MSGAHGPLRGERKGTRHAKERDGQQMSTGYLFPLGAFEVAMRDDPEVRGVLYTGSLGSGAADRFSDLDIELWVTDTAYGRAQAKLRETLERLGAVHFLYYRGAAKATGFVGPAWQRVDLAALTHDALQPCAAYAQARVVKDTDDVLARAVALAPRAFVAGSWDQARAKIEECVDSQIYLALHNARGAVWSALGEISYQCADLYTLLARLRGRESFGFRYVEQLLLPPERALLTQVGPQPRRGRRCAALPVPCGPGPRMSGARRKPSLVVPWR